MTAADISKDSLTLQWKAPDNNGGSPVEKYIVERRDKSGKSWGEVGTVPSSEANVCTLIDDTVVEGNEYYYRVRAVNKAGLGDPCDHGPAFKIVSKPGNYEEELN